MGKYVNRIFPLVGVYPFGTVVHFYLLYLGFCILPAQKLQAWSR